MARPVQKRLDIERGVLQVVAKKGLNATTIQDIALEARVSPGLLYRYWKSRDDLAAQVYAQHYQELVDLLEAQLRGAHDFWHAVENLVNAFLRFADDQPVILKFLLLSQHELVQHVPAERGVRRLLLHVITHGQAAGELREIDPELALQLMLGIGMQPVISVFYGHLPGPAARYAGEIVAAMRGALGAKDRGAGESSGRAGGDRATRGEAPLQAIRRLDQENQP
ncbi:MAG: TetR/AcrR family transcriptional regulator [Phycisphaerae bacterium]|jgi:AcrR family transcriptional regulator|nr:TetR/AcrR family transcriptional regulator [Phycisphaerae bacterium]MCZ2401312.1 TetR/AcrR family transcriptional regulator [Phycisphaerae bacterium]NUQ50603.1 TetR/AcrR family transcriptional regulator [Phycisphaerae bacterium]